MELSKLKNILLASIAKNGNQPLTLQHLVNIIGVIEKQNETEDELDIEWQSHWTGDSDID